MNPVVLLATGILVLIVSFAYKFQRIQFIDNHIYNFLHRRLRIEPWRTVFRWLWPLGRTEFLCFAIVLIAIFNLFLGISATVAYICWGIIDQLIKRTTKRTRPFNCLPGAEMLQPKSPKDTSFPSGDTFHAWFLFFLAWQGFNLPPGVVALLVSLVILISFGRIALGVHYPMDVLGGIGMGIAASGFGLIAYQIVTFFMIHS